jgi:hypothetical protein
LPFFPLQHFGQRICSRPSQAWDRAGQIAASALSELQKTKQTAQVNTEGVHTGELQFAGLLNNVSRYRFGLQILNPKSSSTK